MVTNHGERCRVRGKKTECKEKRIASIPSPKKHKIFQGRELRGGKKKPFFIEKKCGRK